MAERKANIVVLSQSLGERAIREFGQLSTDLATVTLVTGTSIGDATSSMCVVRAPGYSRGSIMARAVSWLKYACFVIGWSRKSVEPGSMIIAYTNPPMLPWIAANVARRSNVPLGLVFWDLYPDVLVRSYPRSGLVRGLSCIWVALNRWAVYRSDWVVTLGDHMASVIRKQLEPELYHRVHVIPFGCDYQSFPQTEAGAGSWFVDKVGLGKFVVLLAGNIGVEHEVEDFLDAGETLRGRTDIVFLVVARGSGFDAVKRDIKNRGLTNVLTLPFQSAESWSNILRGSGVAFVSVRPGFESLMIPSRVYDFLSAGLPVVASVGRDSDLADLITRFECGTVVGHGCVGRLVEAIECFANDDDLRALCARNALTAAQGPLSAENCGRQLSALVSMSLEKAQDGRNDHIRR